MGFSFITGQETVVHADNASFDGTERAGRILLDGQLWIGSTTLPHVVKNTLTAGTGISITNGAGTITIANSGSLTDLHTARFIVGDLTKGANYTTITAALAAASSGDTIFIQTGTYTENLTLKAGVNLTAFGCDGISGFGSSFNASNVIILGTVTASYNGMCVCSGIQFKTNGAAAIATSGANTSNLVLNACSVYAANSTGITLNSANFNVALYNCRLLVDSTNNYFASTTGGMSFTACQFSNSGSPSASTTAVSNISFIGCTMAGVSVTTSSTGTVTVTGCYWNYAGATLLTMAGTGTSTITNSILLSTTASIASIGSGTTLIITNCNLSSSNAAVLTGAGIIESSCLCFSNTSSVINSTTQIPLVVSNDALKITTPGSYPYTTIPQDAVILVDTSSARTITPLASPATGQKHVIKDSVGSAASNNITITPSGKNIDGSASSTININYGSVTIVFNGTEWSII